MDEEDRVFKIGFLLLITIFVGVLQFVLVLDYLGKVSIVFAGAICYLTLFIIRDKNLKRKELENILRIDK